MNAIILLFLVGVIFLGFELFVPGAVMGVVGGLAMAGGCAVAFARFGASGGSLAVLSSLALIGLTLYFEFVVFPRTRTGKKLFLHSAVTATSQPLPAEATAVLGKSAEALTVLAPTGYVMVEGKRYEAFSQDGHVEKGAKLRVTALDQYTLKVVKA